MKIKLFITSLSVAIFLGVVFTSCKRKTECKLKIYTVDSLGLPLKGAVVKLFVNVKTVNGNIIEADVKAQGVSNGVGSSDYTFKLPAILDINANLDNKFGASIIKLEEGKTVEKTVILK
ncbi:MAG: hypothetical protein ACK504_11495 [Bacteroidota bacterium]|jgi:hypothetical protein